MSPKSKTGNGKKQTGKLNKRSPQQRKTKLRPEPIKKTADKN